MGTSFTANKSITMISARSLLFVTLMAMFVLSMAAPDAEAKAEAKAKPEYYYGGQYNGPHHQYYRGYNGYNGHYRGQGYNYNGYNGFNGYRSYGNNYFNYPGYEFHAYQHLY